jgi:hypothetical protein
LIPPSAGGTVLGVDGAAYVLALSRQVEIIEGAIAVVIVALLVVILVLNQRKKREAKPQAQSPSPNYYADLQQQAGGEPDPFAGFGAVSPAPTPAAPAPAAQPAMVSAAPPATNGSPVQQMPSVAMPTLDSPPAPASPMPGTPAGWLQDPSGDPDTLRYWDGNGWTQHVAQRT